MRDRVSSTPVLERTTELRATVRAGGGWPAKDVEPGLQYVRDGLGGLGKQPLEQREARPLVDTN